LFWWFRVVGSLLLHQLVRWCQYNVTSHLLCASVFVGVKQLPKPNQPLATSSFVWFSFIVLLATLRLDQVFAKKSYICSCHTYLTKRNVNKVEGKYTRHCYKHSKHTRLRWVFF
jgi:hypothetical protein